MCSCSCVTFPQCVDELAARSVGTAAAVEKLVAAGKATVGVEYGLPGLPTQSVSLTERPRLLHVGFSTGFPADVRCVFSIAVGAWGFTGKQLGLGNVVAFGNRRAVVVLLHCVRVARVLNAERAAGGEVCTVGSQLVWVVWSMLTSVCSLRKQILLTQNQPAHADTLRLGNRAARVTRLHVVCLPGASS